MKPEQWQEIERLCHLALEREPGERDAFLRESCAGDESLRKEVESLIRRQSKAEDFIESPALELAAKALARDQEHIDSCPEVPNEEVAADSPPSARRGALTRTPARDRV